MKTTAILPMLVLLAGTAALPLGSAFADSQTNSGTTSDPIAQLFAIIQNLLSRITGDEKQVSALEQKTTSLEARIIQLENSHQNTMDNGKNIPVAFLSNSTHNDGHDNEKDHENDMNNNGAHNDGHDNENDKENDTHNNGKHLGQDKHGNKHGQNNQESD